MYAGLMVTDNGSYGQYTCAVTVDAKANWVAWRDQTEDLCQTAFPPGTDSDDYECSLSVRPARSVLVMRTLLAVVGVTCLLSAFSAIASICVCRRMRSQVNKADKRPPFLVGKDEAVVRHIRAHGSTGTCCRCRCCCCHTTWDSPCTSIGILVTTQLLLAVPAVVYPMLSRNESIMVPPVSLPPVMHTYEASTGVHLLYVALFINLMVLVVNLFLRKLMNEVKEVSAAAHLPFFHSLLEQQQHLAAQTTVLQLPLMTDAYEPDVDPVQYVPILQGGRTRILQPQYHSPPASPKSPIIQPSFHALYNVPSPVPAQPAEQWLWRPSAPPAQPRTDNKWYT
jgi:hypothetical protein